MTIWDFIEFSAQQGFGPHSHAHSVVTSLLVTEGLSLVLAAISENRLFSFCLNKCLLICKIHSLLLPTPSKCAWLGTAQNSHFSEG